MAIVRTKHISGRDLTSQSADGKRKHCPRDQYPASLLDSLVHCSRALLIGQLAEGCMNPVSISHVRSFVQLAPAGEEQILHGHSFAWELG